MTPEYDFQSLPEANATWHEPPAQAPAGIETWGASQLQPPYERPSGLQTW
jgi:hypothetical protein